MSEFDGRRESLTHVSLALAAIEDEVRALWPGTEVDDRTQTIRIQFERVRLQLTTFYKRAEDAQTASAIRARLDKADKTIAATRAGFVIDPRTGLRIRRA